MSKQGEIRKRATERMNYDAKNPGWSDTSELTNDVFYLLGETDRLRKELEEAVQAMSEPHKNLWFKLTNERNRAESERRRAERALSSHKYMEEELIKAQKELEKETKQCTEAIRLLAQVTDTLSMGRTPDRSGAALKQIFKWLNENHPVDQEGEGNQ